MVSAVIGAGLLIRPSLTDILAIVAELCVSPY